ncbi:MAG: DUF1592 domain-containing protein [Rhodobacteraceae bacterium]|nr:DUF1592 domain-containing protein [Paracoccaceae bacterium]
MSFFLWNSLPDETLLALAATSELEKPAVIEAQVRRMLSDPKAERFAIEFAGQWLGLRKVGAMLPDPKLYPDYDSVLEAAMRRESEELFRHILVNNRPVTEFLNPGYAMLNERLARHYGIEGVVGRDFRQVALKPGNSRGGLLGHASMLTITSNGTRTSPVVRGIWLLENLLDSPPPPPPPNVEPLEPDVRGAKTIREMLAKHRETEGCAGCHARIDPWGFSLEHFDAIGAWREVYTTKVPAADPKAKAETVTKPIDAGADWWTATPSTVSPACATRSWHVRTGSPTPSQPSCSLMPLVIRPRFARSC